MVYAPRNIPLGGTTFWRTGTTSSFATFQWIGFVGKIFTGVSIDFPMKITFFFSEKITLNQSIECWYFIWLGCAEKMQNENSASKIGNGWCIMDMNIHGSFVIYHGCSMWQYIDLGDSLWTIITGTISMLRELTGALFFFPNRFKNAKSWGFNQQKKYTFPILARFWCQQEIFSQKLVPNTKAL